MVKPRYTRGGHTFEFPILLTHDYTDVRVIAAAYILPPLLGIFLQTQIIRPLWRRHKARKVKGVPFPASPRAFPPIQYTVPSI
jgi:DnaJ family protein C protein 11